MHAHYHTTSKLSRTAGPRAAVTRGLLESLVLYEHIETTEAKAKLIKPAFDRLVTLAKRNNLASVRSLHSRVGKLAAAKLTQELVHGFEGRNSGYTRLIHIGYRRGDAAPLMRVELILDANFEDKLKATQGEAKVAKPKSTKKSSESAAKKVKETAK